MKNILIIGVARAGKTTLSNMIKERYNQYNLIHSDSIVWGIIRGSGKEKYYIDNIKERKELVHGEQFQKTLVEILKASIKKDKGQYGNIFETGQLEPKYISDLIKDTNLYCICLGHGDLDKDGIIKLCREHDTEDEWSYKLTDEQLGINADKWVEKNELLKKECYKYGIEYIDTSKNRDKILKQILEKISNEKR